MHVDLGASPKSLQLSDFQRLILQWQLHQPFLGIDAIEAREEVDVDRLHSAAVEELALIGATVPVVSSDGRSVTYSYDGKLLVESIQPNQELSPLASAAIHFSRELNRPFRLNVDPVIRFWVLRTLPFPLIGMTWQHWSMDGVTAADLFRNILARYGNSPNVGNRGATRLVNTDHSSVYPRELTSMWKRDFLRETTRELFRTTRIFKVPRPRPEQTALQVHLLELDHPRRPAGATINDLVAAATLWALADSLTERFRHCWRRRINLMSIADLRPYGGEALQKNWGLFLGYYIYHLPEPRPRTFGDLVRRISEHSLRTRSFRQFFHSLSSFRLMRALFSWLPKRGRWSFLYKLAPFTAALTNTRHRGAWSVEPLSTRFGRSWRAAPLGNPLPLAIDVCTKGDQLSLALTCEENSYMSQRIDAIKVKIRDLLCEV